MLIGGLEYEGIDDANYLKQTIELLLRHQMDDAIQEIADTYLPCEAELSIVTACSLEPLLQTTSVAITTEQTTTSWLIT